MFKNESCENEIYEQLERNISNQIGIVKNAENKKNVLLIKLCSIAEKLDEMKFEKEAEAVTRLLEIFSKSDSFNHGFDKLSHDELMEGPGEYKREKAEEEELEDEYLNILLGKGNYDSSLDDLSREYKPVKHNDDYLNTLLDTKSYDDILNELNKPKDEDEVSIDY